MKSLFIGLGGVGSGTLDYLNEKMNTYNEDLARQNRPQVDASYYYIDTENARYEQSPQEFLGNGNKRFRQIGNLSPNSIVRGLSRSTAPAEKAQYELLLKWYDAPPKTTNMIKGADTIRQYSRLAFARESSTIRADLYTLIQQVTQQQGRIYVITGSCGGTGCGIYMDVLYMISEIYADQNTDAASTDVRLIMAMPEGYVSDGSLMDVQYEKKKLNAFATLEELNAVCKDRNSIPSHFNGCYIGPRIKDGVFNPFRFGYFFDSAGLKRDEVSQKLSDFLFELELAGDPTAGGGGVAGYNGSFFDGLLTGTVDGNWNQSIHNNYVQAFNALGQYSIEKPDFLYRMYFSDRLLFDVFHKGLIGNPDSVDMNLIPIVTQQFQNLCSAEITNTFNSISANFISKSNFENDRKADITFSVFTKSPNMQEEAVRRIVESKNVLLQTIRGMAFSNCRDWLGKYDFATVYAIINKLDMDAYQEALCTHRDFDDQLANAKKASITGFWGHRSVNPQKALEEFEPLLTTWLTLEVNKALSSGIDVDITIQSQGYLDNCKSFIENAKNSLSLGQELEHWDETFIKQVSNMKAKDDRSYIPDLNTIVDDRNSIIPAPESNMVSIYEQSYVNVQNDDFLHGTCTPVTLHEKIIDEMKASSTLRHEGIYMDDIFDPTPGKQNSLRNVSASSLFVEKYIIAARTQINILLAANQSYQNLFNDDILTRLQNLPNAPKTQKCLDFVGYDKVQLKTEDMGVGQVTTYTYYVLSSTANLPLMQALGILDAAGQKSANTDHTPTNTFFADKIVKLIIKNGYKIDDYRYFGGYKTNAEEKMNGTQPHNPFIDARFRGELDQNGIYKCNVSDALTEIAEGVTASALAETYSLEGCDGVIIYKFCLALLYHYFDSLKKGGHIESELSSAISVSGETITITDFEYKKLQRKYVLKTPSSVNLKTVATTNNMLNLRPWIEYVQNKMSCITSHPDLYVQAANFLVDTLGLALGERFEGVVERMVGNDDYSVDYDFFQAYLNWDEN